MKRPSVFVCKSDHYTGIVTGTNALISTRDCAGNRVQRVTCFHWHNVSLVQGLLEISDNLGLPHETLLKFGIRDGWVGYSLQIKIRYVLKNTAYRAHIRRAWGGRRVVAGSRRVVHL